MTVIGVIIILTALLIFIFTLLFAKLREHLKIILPLATVFGFLGYGTIVYEQIVEFQIPGGGSIKTVARDTVDKANQVTNIAKEVESVKNSVLSQVNTIGMLVRQADELSLKIAEASKLYRETKINMEGFQSFLEQSKNDLHQQIEALHPYRQPVAALNAYLMLMVKANPKNTGRIFRPGFSFTFVKGGQDLLGGTSMFYDAFTLVGGGAYYSSEVTIRIKPGNGPLVLALQDTESIKLTIHGIPENSKIIDGVLYCLLNGSIPLEIPIRTQTAKGKEITVADIKKALQVLKP